MSSVEFVSKQVIAGNSVRRHFERTPEQFAQQILDEAQELVLEIQEALITGCPFGVVGEVGDILILLTQLCEDLGINPVHAMEMKAWRNDLKYPTQIMSNGYTREQAIKMSKDAWKAWGGDERFSYIYLDIMAEDD